MQSLRLSSVRSIGFSIPHAHLDLEKLNITHTSFNSKFDSDREGNLIRIDGHVFGVSESPIYILKVLHMQQYHNYMFVILPDSAWEESLPCVPS